jgi:rubrerythrin
MGYDFNADEILAMAEQIEKNGAAFYRLAAESLSDPAEKKFLQDLARMEDEHEGTFRKMRAALSEEAKLATVFDPQGETEQYLKALADTKVFFEKELDTGSLATILKDAVTAEKDSIVFYLGVRDLVPEEMGKAAIDAIIREEMNHIKTLGKKLATLK